MAALGRLFARSTKAAEETVPLISRQAEAEANAATRISHAVESSAKYASTGKTVVATGKASVGFATAGVIGYGGYTAINAARGVPDAVKQGAENLGKGLENLGEGLLNAIESAMHLPAEIAGGIPALSSGHSMELVAVTVVALGAGFVLLHYVTN